MSTRASLISLVLGLSFHVYAEEQNKPPETLVLRINNDTQQIEMYESKVELRGTEDSLARIENQKFQPVKPKEPTNELDRDSSTNSQVYGGYRGPRWGVSGGYAPGYGWNFNFYYGPRYYSPYPYYPYYPMYNSRYYCCGANYFYGGYNYYYRPYYYAPRGHYSYYYYGRRRY